MKPTLSLSSMAVLRRGGVFRHFACAPRPEARPAAVSYGDITRCPPGGDTASVPLHARAPNVGYLLRLGKLPDARDLYMWGMTTDFSRRFREHSAEHGSCQIVMVINVDKQQPKHLEDVMKHYFRHDEVRIDRPNGSKLRECLAVPPDDGEYLARFHAFIVRNLRDSVHHITFEGVTTSYVRVTPFDTSVPDGDLAILLEIEKLRLEQERQRSARWALPG